MNYGVIIHSIISGNIYIYIYIYIYILGVSISSRCFCKNCGFIMKKLCTVFYSKYCPSLLFLIFLAAYEFCAERTWHLLRLSTNRPIFWYLHMKRTSVWIDRVSSLRTRGNQTGQYQESRAGGVGLSISAFPSLFWWSVRHEIEYCNAGELLCRIFARIAAVFISMLGSISIEIDTDPL